MGAGKESIPLHNTPTRALKIFELAIIELYRTSVEVARKNMSVPSMCQQCMHFSWAYFSAVYNVFTKELASGDGIARIKSVWNRGEK